MNADDFLATALLKVMVDAGGQRFDIAWLIEKTEVTRREVLRGLKRLERWEAVTLVRESREKRPEVVAVSVTEETYATYRRLFSGPPPS